MKENALYITRKGTRVAGKITDPCMGVQLRDVALRPVPNVELHMCRIIAKEREQIFHVRIKITNTKFDLLLECESRQEFDLHGGGKGGAGGGGRWWKVC